MAEFNKITIDRSLSSKPHATPGDQQYFVVTENGAIKLVALSSVAPKGMEDLGRVSAQAIAEVLSRVKTLESQQNQALHGDLIFDSILTEAIKIKGAKLFLQGHGVPSAAPDFVGQEYVDVDGKRAYKAVGTGSVSDWKPITNP